MRKLSLSEWAAVGELVATFAVFVSLLFVIYSINQNTAALQGSTENLMFDRIGGLWIEVATDSSLAAILVKKRDGNSDLTEVEEVRWEKYRFILLDIWALAYGRHQRGLLAADQWEAWDRYFAELFSVGGERLSKEEWQALANGFDSDFWDHVDALLFPG